MRLIFCGDRFWKNRSLISDVMSCVRTGIGDFTVVEGEALGADIISRELAEKVYKLPFEPHPADWNKYGRAAGPIRNSEMLKSGVDGIVAFHDNLDGSKGTRNMVQQALKAGVPVWVSNQGPMELLRFIRILQERRR